MSIGKKLALSTILVASLSFTGSAFAGDVSGTYSVELNKTEIVRLSEPASAVIIGNPKIADVSVHSSDTVFVLGRGYGQTNLIVLNMAGQTIFDSDIQVVAPVSVGNVRLYSGRARETYSCAPYCLPAPVLGDSVEFVVVNTPETREINTPAISSSISRQPSFVGMAVEGEPELAEDDPRRPYYPSGE